MSNDAPVIADSADKLEQLGINVIRGLAMDGPDAANSGHQGTAMALAPLAHVLFTKILTYDSSAPEWPDRDRLILSAGHASILLYSLLHLTGYDVSLDDLKQFRQWDSLTPGHPEVGHTPGVEVTTGPLGQGFANSVGAAITERFLRQTYGEETCNHFTYTIVGDGCLSEGISHEAASLAGHLGLGRLIAIYDDNKITIDGPTALALSDDAATRFRSYGWDVIEVAPEATNVANIERALLDAKAMTGAPSLVILKTKVGFPSPKFTGHHSAHGNPFDADEISITKAVMGLPPDGKFHVPAEVAEMYQNAGRRSQQSRIEWEARNAEDNLYGGFDHEAVDQSLGDLAENLRQETKMATRKASQRCISAVAPQVPNLIGGSADLTDSNGIRISETAQSSETPDGRQIFFGVREHAMGAALVGAALHGGVVPTGGTFLVFSDYVRPSVRLAAMSQAKCIFVWSHDSVGVGEDGPTHQPIEQLMSLRLIPNLTVIRPADAIETAGAWAAALDNDGPTALILSRQDLPVLAGSNHEKVRDGAYVVRDAVTPAATLIGTGSEVHLCVEAAERLSQRGHEVQVVSMPSWELFETSGQRLWNDSAPVVSVEAGVTTGWQRYSDSQIGIDRFGASAPGDLVMNNLGVSVEAVVDETMSLLG